MPNRHKVTTPQNDHIHTLNMLKHIFQIIRLQNPKKNVFQGTRISEPSPPLQLPKIKHIEEMMFFMHKNIKRIVNFERVDNFGFRAFRDCSVRERITTNLFVIILYIR